MHEERSYENPIYILITVSFGKLLTLGTCSRWHVPVLDAGTAQHAADVGGEAPPP